jgi:hypothetical protein
MRLIRDIESVAGNALRQCEQSFQRAQAAIDFIGPAWLLPAVNRSDGSIRRETISAYPRAASIPIWLSGGWDDSHLQNRAVDKLAFERKSSLQMSGAQDACSHDIASAQVCTALFHCWKHCSRIALYRSAVSW